VCSVEGREEFRIRFPKVEGYRLEIPDDELLFDFAGAERLRVDREQVATWTRSAGIAGEEEDVDLSHFDAIRPQQVAYEVARVVVDSHLRVGEDRRPWLFPRVAELTREWLRSHVDLQDGLSIGFLTLAEYRQEAAEKVHRAISTSPGSRRGRLRPLLRRFDAEGSTAGISFLTRKNSVPADEKCELNRSSWTGSAATHGSRS
jgi:type III restriction enzyme